MTVAATAPTKFRDVYHCHGCQGETRRIRLNYENPNWGGIVVCQCGSGNTTISATGLPYVEPEDFEPHPRFARGGIVTPVTHPVGAAPIEDFIPRGTYEELFK